jgi:hypothetical protein
MSGDLDGLLTFFGSHHAIRADNVLRKAGLAAKLIPGPKDMSPNCGTAVRICLGEWTKAQAVLSKRKVTIDEVLAWVPATDSWSKPKRTSL